MYHLCTSISKFTNLLFEFQGSIEFLHFSKGSLRNCLFLFPARITPFGVRTNSTFTNLLFEFQDPAPFTSTRAAFTKQPLHYTPLALAPRRVSAEAGAP